MLFRVKTFSPSLAQLIARQDGVVSAEQLLVHGFDRDVVYRRVKAGRWQRLLPGLILTNSGHPSRRQLLIAGVLWGGPGAAIDGADACAWYGIRTSSLDGRRVHVVVPWDAPARTRGFVVVRRATAEIRVGARARVPYVDAATALIVAARGARSTASAMDVLSRGLQTGLVSVAQLTEAREAIGDKWCRDVDAALVAVGVGLRSPAEKTNCDLILTSRLLPEPRWNQWLDLGDGGSVLCVDALWDDAGMAEEVLGKKWHAWGQRFESTEARRARIVAAGIALQGATPTQLRREGPAVLDRLERTYLQHVGRGMPPGVQLLDANDNRVLVVLKRDQQAIA